MYHDVDAWRRYMSDAGFVELSHYYRPTGLPREQATLAGERLAADDELRRISPSGGTACRRTTWRIQRCSSHKIPYRHAACPDDGVGVLIAPAEWIVTPALLFRDYTANHYYNFAGCKVAAIARQAQSRERRYSFARK